MKNPSSFSKILLHSQSEVVIEYPLKQMIDFHKHHGGEASIMVTKVEEPSKYAIVVMEEEIGLVQRFVEKPQIFVGNKINAGIRLLNLATLDRIQLQPENLHNNAPFSQCYLPESISNGANPRPRSSSSKLIIRATLASFLACNRLIDASFIIASLQLFQPNHCV
ncbi:hypothetical protein O6H91_01G074100 [Diphasiastrum complanatum]|uniref:Uncharacterized protein n=1 Tax=Diphasiastrum complanatum TaxID=34168 RepID=A0ACC2ESL4_DIPCM|nr:hypothetical protein O6H91_01G074100 [Diphasiastrum complanatum]